MSMTFESEASREELVEFLTNEYEVDSGIPVHLYSVVNATFTSFNGVLAITDGNTGVMFLEDEHHFKSYGSGNPIPMMRTLNRCNVGLSFVD